MSTVVWFRLDLRVNDNEALQAAAAIGEPIIPVFIWAPHEEGKFPPGGASKWWLHYSLISLRQTLYSKGLELIVRCGDSEAELCHIISEVAARRVYWNRRYEPAVIKRDERIKHKLLESGVEAKSFAGNLLVEPWHVTNKQKRPYQVYTPFSKWYFENYELRVELLLQELLVAPTAWPESCDIDSLNLLPVFNWADGLSAHWVPGEESALAQLKHFLETSARHYKDHRDFPSVAGTSRLSPHLHFGEISPARVWREVERVYPKAKPEGVQTFLKEVLWREFGYHLLYHFPKTESLPLREEFRVFPWRRSKKLLRVWQKGMTGYPIVDAGMRELWATGWMHNRVRMIVASFLVKHLLIRWQDGARWFWDTLVDADLASNTLGWQWTAGCGADAAPFFRIFNPIIQGEKFDSSGEYVRKWVPEIALLPNKFIHQPWEAPEDVLESCGVKLGVSYPFPIVEHGEARDLALEAYEMMREAGEA